MFPGKYGTYGTRTHYLGTGRYLPRYRTVRYLLSLSEMVYHYGTITGTNIKKVVPCQRLVPRYLTYIYSDHKKILFEQDNS